MNLSNPASSFQQEYAYMGAVFCINQQIYDENYMLIPLSLARTLFNYSQEVSALELKLKTGVDLSATKQQIRTRLGEDFRVEDRYEQQQASFKMMQVEKWMTFLILCFILTIALFNVVGSLSMLMIEKRDDAVTLRNMGADSRLIRRIFLFEGWMIAGFGALIGIVVGVTLCLMQQQWGFIKLGESSGSFIIDAYPVRVELADILAVLGTVLSIGFLAAWYPVHYLGKRWM